MLMISALEETQNMIGRKFGRKDIFIAITRTFYDGVYQRDIFFHRDSQ